jgi:hypothetical protein
MRDAKARIWEDWRRGGLYLGAVVGLGAVLINHSSLKGLVASSAQEWSV